MNKSGDLDAIVEDNIWFILAITLLMMIIQNTFTVIPLLLVITVNYVLFGFTKGFIWSWMTSIIGSAIIFLGARYLFQDWVTKKVDQTLLAKIEKKGFRFVFQARIIPFVPTSLINILSGISSIKFNSFIMATCWGNFLYFFLMILIPAGFLNVQMNEYLLEGGILLLILVIFFFKLIERRKKRSSESVHNKRNGEN
jgi:uncharacterized membrane protein YdjX (TVP38/TMEM64 family)